MWPYYGGIWYGREVGLGKYQSYFQATTYKDIHNYPEMATKQASINFLLTPMRPLTIEQKQLLAWKPKTPNLRKKFAGVSLKDAQSIKSSPTVSVA